MEEKEYSVSEAVRLIGVESHVLRYWEEELQIVIRRTNQGHRIYSKENVKTFQQVKKLKEKGIQLKAIRVLLEETPKVEDIHPEEERLFVEQIQEIDQKISCEVFLPEEKGDHLKQFETILKQMIQEVVEEQNEKLEQNFIRILKEEINLWCQKYHELSLTEAAAVSEMQKKGIFQKLLEKRKKK